MKDFVTPNKVKHQYILGIDFGHGETSADICNIQWDDNCLKLSAPEAVEIFNGQQTTISALLIEDGLDINNEKTTNYYVGQQATDRYGNRHRQKTSGMTSQFYSYFKNIPSLMSETEKNVMLHFMQGIYQQIRNQRSELTDDNHVVYIACPSNAIKWTDEEMKEYAAIALEAGIPLAKIGTNNIGIIRESRAAFIKARSNPNSKTSVKEGILLIDFGSSTVDLTYYSSLLQKPEDGGNDCGAQRVEKEILDQLKRNSDLAATCCADKSGESATLLEIRQKKEAYYASNSLGLELEINAIKVTGGRIASGKIEAFYYPEDIDSILQQYKEELIRGFEEFRDKHLNSHPIRLVYMTGGASRMDFIKDIVREVFNYDGDFYRETNPSLSISNGIALAGRADMRSAALLEKLESDSSLSKDIAAEVINATAESMTDAIVNKISEKYSSFANQSSDENIAGLEKRIKEAIDSISLSAILSDKFKEILKMEVNKNVLPSLNSIVGEYFPDGSINNISSSRYISVPLSVNDRHYGSIVADSVNSISEGFWESAGKVAATVAGGIFSAAGGILAWGVGQVHDAFTEKESNKWNVNGFEVFNDGCEVFTPNWRDKYTKLSKKQRQKVYSHFNGNKSSYTSGIKDKIKSALNTESLLKTKLNAAFKEETIKYIREQVDIVRLMLN